MKSFSYFVQPKTLRVKPLVFCFFVCLCPTTPYGSSWIRSVPPITIWFRMEGIGAHVSMSHHSIWKFMNSFCSLDYDLVQNGGHGSTCKSKIPGCSCLCVAVHPTVLWPRIYGHSSTEHKSTTAQRQRTIPIFDCNTISSCLCIAMSHLSDPEVAWIHSVSPITIWIRMEDLVAHETNKQNGGLLDRRHLEDNLPTAQSQFAWSTASPKNISLNRGTAYSTDSYGWVKILVLVTRDINRGTAYSTDSYGWVKFWSSWLEI